MPFSLPSTQIKMTSRLKANGFTLLEIIVGILVLSIALSIISTLIAPAEEQSADQVLQVKAAELGQSLLNDISSRAFDQNSDMAGGRVRCGELSLGALACTTNLGPEDGNGGRPNFGESSRGLFNDVDDFHNYSAKINANDEDLAQGYDNFIIDVQVVYDGSSLGLANNIDAKKITVSITTSLGTTIQFATHKANF